MVLGLLIIVFFDLMSILRAHSTQTVPCHFPSIPWGPYSLVQSWQRPVA